MPKSPRLPDDHLGVRPDALKRAIRVLRAIDLSADPSAADEAAPGVASALVD